ncbi:MAG: hypothetical protein KIT31_27130 [Deltaproteobacteria bacterium]|nr:hypothetical protein [Deltaproteobacteria bacterium]
MLMSSKGVGERFGSYEIYDELGAGGIASVHLLQRRPERRSAALVLTYQIV